MNRIVSLLEDKRFMELKTELLEEQVQDIAELVDELDPKSALLVFRLLPKDMAVDVFAYLEPEIQAAISQLVNENELKKLWMRCFSMI